MHARIVRANGLAFEVYEAGGGDRLALCLHGFPEHAIAWEPHVATLVALGYRVWAPNQRGYGGTSRPRDVAAYRIAHLLDDVAALIDASGAREVVLIGHDWGAVVAWFFAMRMPRPVAKLVILNVPHPAVFLATLRRSPRQWARSWYVLAFSIPGLAEWALGRDGAAPVVRLFERSSKLRTPFLRRNSRRIARKPRSPGRYARCSRGIGLPYAAGLQSSARSDSRASLLRRV